MKRTAILLIFALVLGAMTGCSGAAPAEQTTAPAESLPAESSPAEPQVLDLQAIYDDLTAAENIPAMLALDADMQMMFCGIDPADCTQSIAAICENSLRADEIWLIEAVDEAALGRIREAAELRLTAKSEESITYSPEQYAIVQEAQIITSGNYFVLLVSPDVDMLAQMFRDAAGI